MNSTEGTVGRDAERDSIADAASPPGPRGLPVLGNTHQLLRDPLSFYERLAHDFSGEVTAYSVLGDPGYMLSHPDDVEAVLVSQSQDFVKGQVWQDSIGELVENSLVLLEGERWHRHRQAFQPAFTMDRLASYGDTMSEYAARVATQWTDGDRLRIDEEMRTYTLDVLGKTLFDLDVGSERRETLARVAQVMTGSFDLSSVSAYLPMWVPTPANRRCQRALAEFRSVVDEIVRERRASEEMPDDLLSMMLSMASEADEEDAAMSDRELRNDLVAFIFAGHETTSLALTYTWHLLATNPECQRRLQAEVDELEGDPGVEDLDRLQYTERVLSEAMRLYPPVPLILREPTRDVEIGGYTIPEGSAIAISQWVLHRDERWWPEPEAFRPDRWADDDPERPEYAYAPFGGGPRHCIGMRFARMEAKLALATIARRWTFEPVEASPPDVSIRVTLQPDDGVALVPKRRQ